MMTIIIVMFKLITCYYLRGKREKTERKIVHRINAMFGIVY